MHELAQFYYVQRANQIRHLTTLRLKTRTNDRKHFQVDVGAIARVYRS